MMRGQEDLQSPRVVECILTDNRHVKLALTCNFFSLSVGNVSHVDGYFHSQCGM